ncbi:lipid IV(A) 3-deoxy-D-manno-octulosonic acid transferase [Marinobacterium sp. D7]|uniref:lipid IV(A) 3-deoxy-D-manno-octulosonic acid transferase n=1 Tax=Marinobacterium ramblicola TaxID=2849041 RepID=UPI001C2CEDFD|nr:lipid IV(A) 3-deoxy-D-manno-octulosonic acid transferase [Marinobacterium ramblicola]MBV1788370.1 lipid IV(A) 3-deoxy-D-manno-octulosonic acid transferase [Marinobacterium ramblicola]
MARRLYTLVFTLALPLVLARLWWRGRKAPAYRQRVKERLGFIPAPEFSAKPVWIHAVSVGETLAIAPLVQRLLESYPQRPVLITTMTPTGAERVQALFGERVTHRYCPWDLPWFWARFLERSKPLLCVVVETELWPNMLHSCAGRDIPVLLANARMSARSARGYARFAALTRPMLEQLTLVAAQSHADGERLHQLGLPSDRLKITGSIKFDIEPDPADIGAGAALRVQLGDTRPVLIAASTHEGEDELLLRVWKALCLDWPSLALILVPRHPERFASVAALARRYSDRVCRRSAAETPSLETEIYIGDTLGELMQIYAAADIAFVGGSFSGTGGHNPLEPAALGKPVLMGPDTFNFAQITQALSDAGGLVQVADEVGLLRTLRELVGNAERCAAMAQAARRFVADNRGALDRLQQLVEGELSAAERNQRL